MDFKQKSKELVSCFKGLKSFNFSNQLGQFTKSIPSVIGAAGALLMLIGVFIPFFTHSFNTGYELFGYSVGGSSGSESVHLIATAFGWLVLLLSLAIIGLSFLKQNFWSGLSSALCLLITVITIIVCAATANFNVGGDSYYLSSQVSNYPSVGFFFLLFGELAVIAAFILDTFVFKAPAVAPQYQPQQAPQYQPQQAPQYQQPQAPQYQQPQAPQYPQPQAPQYPQPQAPQYQQPQAPQYQPPQGNEPPQQ